MEEAVTTIPKVPHGMEDWLQWGIAVACFLGELDDCV
jgi:hypothetical protein